MNIYQYGGTALSKGHPDDAGWDLHAGENLTVHVGESILLKTGIYLAMPKGTYGMVCSRSGLASRGLVVGNAPGIIDCGYRGEILINMHYRGDGEGDDAMHIRVGTRVAQIVFQNLPPSEVSQVQFLHLLDQFWHSSRGQGGHGSTGE
jgi:dUTP pyrophosphatase